MDKLAAPKSTFPPLLHLTYVLQQLSDERLGREVGVGLSQARMLSALSASPCSQRHVAAALGQTEANVSRQLHNMKKRGLVEIKRNKSDARQRDVSLTRKGKNAHAKAHKILLKQQSDFWKTLNRGEAAALETALQKLATDN